LPVHFLHFRTGDLRQLGHAEEMLAVVDEARAAGQDVTIASYPYTPGGGGLRVPAWAEEGGPPAILRRLADPETRAQIVAEWNARWNWESRIASTTTAKNKWCEGKTLAEIGAVTGESIGEVICRLIEEENLGVEAIHYLGDEDDVRRIMTHPAHMACSDAQYSGDFLHPRAYGSYPRYLGRYVRELGLLSLEDCVRRMTSFPAQRMGLDDRGLLKAGMVADVVVFNAAAISDRASYAAPRQYPAGIDYVLVNGVVVIEAGAYTGLTPGRPVRRRRLELAHH
jgi:N-acyl-D-amino-acid deacylase